MDFAKCLPCGSKSRRCYCDREVFVQHHPEDLLVSWALLPEPRAVKHAETRPRVAKIDVTQWPVRRSKNPEGLLKPGRELAGAFEITGKQGFC